MTLVFVPSTNGVAFTLNHEPISTQVVARVRHVCMRLAGRVLRDPKDKAFRSPDNQTLLPSHHLCEVSTANIVSGTS